MCLKWPIITTVVVTATVCSSKLNSQALLLPDDSLISYSAVEVSESADPHALGPRVELCKLIGMWSGLFSEYFGPLADPPIGRLENVEIDEATGSISFTAQLTVGLTPQGADEAPAVRRYRFSGRIDDDTIRGALVIELANGASGATTNEEITLRRENRNAAFAESCDQWNQMRTQLLILRNTPEF